MKVNWNLIGICTVVASICINLCKTHEKTEFSRQGLLSFLEYLDYQVTFLQSQTKALRLFSIDLIDSLEHYLNDEFRIIFHLNNDSFTLDRLRKVNSSCDQNMTDTRIGPLCLSKSLIEQALTELEALLLTIELMAETKQQLRDGITRETNRTEIWDKTQQHIPIEMNRKISLFVSTINDLIRYLIAQIEFHFIRFYLSAKRLMEQEVQGTTRRPNAITYEAKSDRLIQGPSGEVNSSGSSSPTVNSSQSSSEFQPFHSVLNRRKYGIEMAQVIHNQDMQLYFRLVLKKKV